MFKKIFGRNKKTDSRNGSKDSNPNSRKGSASSNIEYERRMSKSSRRSIASSVSSFSVDNPSDWKRSAKIKLWLTAYKNTCKTELRVYEGIPLELLLAFCHVMGARSIGCKLDKVLFGDNASDLRSSDGLLNSTLKDLGFYDGMEMALRPDLEGHEDRMKKATIILETYETNEEMVKGALNAMRDMAMKTFQPPPGDEEDGGRLYYWLPYIRHLLTKHTDHYREFLEQTNYRLLLALESGDEDLFNQSVLHTHTRVYCSATFEVRLLQLEGKLVDTYDLAIRTKNNLLPISIKQNETIEFLLALCQTIDPEMLGKQIELRFKEYVQSEERIRSYKTGPITDDEMQTSLGNSVFSDVPVRYLRQEVRIRTFTEDENEEMAPLTDWQRSMRAAKLLQLLPKAISHIQKDRFMLAYIANFNNRLFVLIDNYDTDEQQRSVDEFMRGLMEERGIAPLHPMLLKPQRNFAHSDLKTLF